MVSAYWSGLANPRGEGLAVGVEPGLADGRLGDEQAGVVEVIVHAALDAAGVGLHQDAMASARLDVEPDVEEVRRIQLEHGDVAEDDLAVGRGRAGGGEGAAVLGLGACGLPRRRLAESACLPARWAWPRGPIEDVDLDLGVERHDVDQVERRGRRSLPPAAEAPSAIPFISSRYSLS